MTKNTPNLNPIILIDDDVEDIEIFKEGFKDLKIENEIIVFTDGNKFYEYICSTKTNTFFIFCDINMNALNGFKLKEKIFDDEAVRLKCIPFLMMSTSGSSPRTMEAYSLNVQGYFIKPTNLSELKELFDTVVKYWSLSQRPATSM